MMNNLDKQYLELLKDIKENGVRKEGRNGVTYSVFGRTIRHDMREGFPLLTTKEMWWKGIVTELLWFLSGNTNIQSLVKQGNNIWVGDAYKRYLDYCETIENPTLEPLVLEDDKYRVYTEEEFIEKIKTDDEFAKEWGEMGPIYGAQWRQWSLIGDGEVYNGLYTNEEYEKMNSIDQIQNLLDTLKENPDSRRMLVSAWNVGDLDEMVLPPCHYGFSVWTRELHWGEREYKTGWLEGGKEALRKNYLQRCNGRMFDGKDIFKNHEYRGKYDWDENTPLEKIQDDVGLPTRGISLMWRQRSVDTPLGLPFNIASYGLLLEMIANEMNMVPLELIGSLEDTHIYENQMEGVEEQLQRKGYDELPNLILEDGIYSNDVDIHLENYNSDGKIYFPLSN